MMLLPKGFLSPKPGRMLPAAGAWREIGMFPEAANGSGITESDS